MKCLSGRVDFDWLVRLAGLRLMLVTAFMDAFNLHMILHLSEAERLYSLVALCFFWRFSETCVFLFHVFLGFLLVILVQVHVFRQSLPPAHYHFLLYPVLFHCRNHVSSCSSFSNFFPISASLGSILDLNWFTWAITCCLFFSNIIGLYHFAIGILLFLDLILCLFYAKQFLCKMKWLLRLWFVFLLTQKYNWLVWVLFTLYGFGSLSDN